MTRELRKKLTLYLNIATLRLFISNLTRKNKLLNNINKNYEPVKRNLENNRKINKRKKNI
ncbi:hypothetical protein [Staphylococcus aureus]|uniref:hypothetical protein n=1 Tax=Staphylococcus aureus TaxID=1280 RepID=UPI001C1F3560|nr:hypothetical protein [Staphylococcus aureus]MBU7198801.1 hypothetical protein [Staphylococcus aureus]